MEDKSLNQLVELYRKHGLNQEFLLESLSFYLTEDGHKWLTQVSFDPVKFKFSAQGEKVLKSIPGLVS